VVYQLIYSSAVSPSLSDDTMVKIAQHAQKANSKIGVTGMMVCHQGSILQVLEGNKEVVETLYKKICNDNRHTQVLLLIRRETDKREFADWAMGFKRLPDEDITDPNLTPLLAKTYKDVFPDNASTVLKTISKSFARVNGIEVDCS